MSNYQNHDSQVLSPRDLSYMKLVAKFLNHLAVWPLVDTKNKIYTFAVKKNIAWFTSLSIIFVLQLVYIRYHISTTSFEKMGHNYITFTTNILCLQRLLMPWLAEYRNVIKDFVDKMHLFHQKDKSDYAMKIHNNVEKICKWFTIYILVQNYAGIALFIITPTFKNWSAGMYSSNKPANVTFETALYIDLYFVDTLTDLKGHLVLFALSCFSCDIVASCLCLCYLLLSLIIFHVWGHLKILGHNLDNFPKPANYQTTSGEGSWYTEEESKKVTALLVSLVDHHRLIQDFMSQVSSTYSLFLLLNFALYQFAGCIVLLECSKLDSESLGNYGPLLVVLFQQLIQVSVIFELIGTQSATLIDSVYGLPWECMGPNNRKLVLFFLQNVQEPISLKACGMLPVGVQTMAAVLKACGSYFLMLRTVTTTEEAM